MIAGYVPPEKKTAKIGIVRKTLYRSLGKRAVSSAAMAYSPAQPMIDSAMTVSVACSRDISIHTATEIKANINAANQRKLGRCSGGGDNHRAVELSINHQVETTIIELMDQR